MIRVALLCVCLMACSTTRGIDPVTDLAEFAHALATNSGDDARLAFELERKARRVVEARQQSFVKDATITEMASLLDDNNLGFAVCWALEDLGMRAAAAAPIARAQLAALDEPRPLMFGGPPPRMRTCLATLAAFAP